jgi:protein-S-isoprenylcysteine O-methyltransferase Ste14
MEAVTVSISRSLSQRLKNASASLLLLALTYLFCSLVPYYQVYASKERPLLFHSFATWDALQTVYSVYGILLLIYYLTEKNPQISKSIYCLRGLQKLVRMPWRRHGAGVSPQERLGMLATLLKAFFGPLMVAWLIGHTTLMINNGVYLVDHFELLHTEFLSIFNAHGYWFLLQVILFLDVLFFTIGYLVEMPILRNQIRSVDPTALGWLVALACYPPFNDITSSILSWTPDEFPQFETPVIHLTANFLLLGLMAVYTSASVALNFKASNLTHRGIIAHGPYRFVRHPAYTCKNLAWWVAAIPALHTALGTSAWSALLVLSSVGGWTLIYALRALTEEDHLRKVDDEYDNYCERVRYRFIPGLI